MAAASLATRPRYACATLDTISLDWDLDYFDAFEEGNAVRHEGVWETSPKAADSTRGF